MKYLKKYIVETKRYYNNIDNIISYVHEICGGEYSVIDGDPIDGRSRVKIRHNSCGHIWSPEIRSFIYGGRRCPECFGKKKLTTIDIIKRCKEIHGDEYKIIDTSGYINNKSMISVIHNVCQHKYYVSVQNLLNKRSKCAKCSGKLKLSKDNVILRFNKIYGTDYKPFLIDDPKNGKSKIKILHKVCGNEWVASISNILYQNTGCPFCKISKGERMIKKYLDDNNISYMIQHRFQGCRYIRPLPFDFFIPSKNICIEYDGIQHFEAIPFFGGEASLIRNKKVDDIKSSFCDSNDIELIRVGYNDRLKINSILDEVFKKL